MDLKRLLKGTTIISKFNKAAAKCYCQDFLGVLVIGAFIIGTGFGAYSCKVILTVICKLFTLLCYPVLVSCLEVKV